MARIVDIFEERPYTCEDCKHFLSGLKCRAFELIPLEYYADAETHSTVVPEQKGSYVFVTDKPRETMRIYVDEEAEG